MRAYLEEFRNDEAVELHIVTHPFMETVRGLACRAGWGG